MYVLGDIHGNMNDLRFFSENLWTLGMPLTAGSFLFLGDYVDRGQNSLEVVAYLFALKVRTPFKLLAYKWYCMRCQLVWAMLWLLFIV